MKSLNQYIQEKLIINKDYHDNMIVVKSFDELRKIIIDRYYELGPGTKQNPIDFNDIDVSNIDSFCNKYNIGIFEYTRFKYIDISDWDVSNVTNMSAMFFNCDELESVGDISKWDVSNVSNMSRMFYNCRSFNQYISNWDVSKVTNMAGMFCSCKNFNQDISSWNVSKVTDMSGMFEGCKKFNQDISSWNVSSVKDMQCMFAYCEKFNQDLSDWDVSNVRKHLSMFDYCPIKDEYKPKFKKITMTREQAKHLAEIFNAYAEGKTIEVFLDLDWKWVEVPSDGYCFDVENKSYRIKKEPKYRPFKNAKECLEEMRKHQPVGWVKSKKTSMFYCITTLGESLIAINSCYYKFNECYYNFNFADGQPLGIKE